MSTKIELCEIDQVAVGAALRVEVDGLAVAVFNVEGEFYVTDDACTHGPGLLSEGYIDGDLVECNFHNGQFNIRTGEVAAPPCMILLSRRTELQSMAAKSLSRQSEINLKAEARQRQ